MNVERTTLADPLLEAQRQVKRLAELQQQYACHANGVGMALELTAAKKYQVYARALLQAARQDEAPAGDGQPLPAPTAALVSRLQQYATEESALRAPALSVLAASQGEATVRRLVGTVLRHFAESVNVKNRVSLVQLHEMAVLVPLEFGDLSLTDVVLCLRHTKAGRYGPLYESFDTVKLGEFLRRYRTEKEELRELRHRQAKCAQSNLLVEIVAKLDTAPAHVREGIRSFGKRAVEKFEAEKAAAGAAASHNLPPGTDFAADHSALFAEREKPKPKHPRPVPLGESDFRRRVQQRLAPCLHLLDDEELAEAVAYYRQHREEALARWLEAEQARRAEGRSGEQGGAFS